MITRIRHSITLIFLLLTVSFSEAFEQDFLELTRPYFCSTCFTTTQDQNYHCCFYFFKCCAEARFGSRSTTPDPNYPGLPSGMTFFVQNRNAQPCSVDCRDPKQAPNLCCRLQGSQRSKSSNPPPLQSEDNVFKPAYSVQTMVTENSGVTQQQSTPEIDTKPETPQVETSLATDEEDANKNKYHNLGLDITGSPIRHNLRNINSERKIFHAPSLIFDHETEDDANRGGESWRKQGWYTKDILNKEINHQEKER